jgi:biotin carboxyl carrier protein
MPGRILSIGAAIGVSVEAGDTVLTLEAMKMEHAVTTPGAGRLADLFVAAGDQVSRGQRLAIVEPG